MKHYLFIRQVVAMTTSPHGSSIAQSVWNNVGEFGFFDAAANAAKILGAGDNYRCVPYDLTRI